MPRRRWLGPTIVGVGAAVAAVGVWYVLHARPKAGDVIDSFDLGNGGTLLVRAEAGGERSFIELRDHDEVVWQALIPHYAGAKGRPALAWSQVAVTVRVERSGRAEVFAIAMNDAAKLGGFRLAPEHEPIATQSDGPITLTDHVRSYELVGGADWHQLVAVDLATGKALWKDELGRQPITEGHIEGSLIWLTQGPRKRRFNMFNGSEDRSPLPGDVQ
jgi:hypothetical protein